MFKKIKFIQNILKFICDIFTLDGQPCNAMYQNHFYTLIQKKINFKNSIHTIQPAEIGS